MKFDEAIEVLANSQNNKLVKEGQLAYGLYRAYDVVGMLQELKKEYAPKIEMTKEEKNTLGHYLENSTFFSLIERKHAGINVELIGITIGSNEFLDLSDEDLMQAWLHPNDIQIIDKE